MSDQKTDEQKAIEAARDRRREVFKSGAQPAEKSSGKKSESTDK